MKLLASLRDQIRNQPVRQVLIRCIGVGLAALAAGCASASPTATPIATAVPANPTVALTQTFTRTPLPSLTPSGTFAAAGSTATPLPAVSTQPPGATQAAPTSTSALLAMTPQTSPSPNATQPLVSDGSAPPLTMQLPPNWKSAFKVVAIRDQLEQSTMNIAYFVGPIREATGTIIVLWGFPSMGAPPTAANAPVTSTGTADPNAPPQDLESQLLWADGLRLLQGTIVGITCNVGHYEQRTFLVGQKPGVGAYFNSAQCQGEPDTVGWFSGLKQNGRRYLFYMYIEPITSYNDARKDLQAILDTVVFSPPAGTTVPPTVPPTNTPKVSGPVTPTTTPVLQ